MITAWWACLPCHQGARPQAPRAPRPSTHVHVESPGHTPDMGQVQAGAVCVS